MEELIERYGSVSGSLKVLSEAFWNTPSRDLVTESDFSFLGNEQVDELLGKARDTLTEEGYRDIRVDYARITAGTNVDDPLPYESIYRGEARLLMQGSRDEVLALYQAHGFKPRPGEPEDHLSNELDFICHLCEDAERSAGAGEHDRAQASRDAAKGFASGHVAKWLPRYCEEALGRVETAYFRGLLLALADLFSFEVGNVDS